MPGNVKPTWSQVQLDLLWRQLLLAPLLALLGFSKAGGIHDVLRRTALAQQLLPGVATGRIRLLWPREVLGVRSWAQQEVVSTEASCSWAWGAHGACLPSPALKGRVSPLGLDSQPGKCQPPRQPLPGAPGHPEPQGVGHCLPSGPLPQPGEWGPGLHPKGEGAERGHLAGPGPESASGYLVLN